MRKRNKLYTVNKWNQPLFMNTFDDGGNLLGFDQAASKAYGANYGNKGFTLNDYMGSKNFLGISKANNPFSKGNLLGTFSKQNLGNALKNGAGAIGSAVGGIGNRLLSNGYSSGAGNAISGVGGTLGAAISTVNPLVGGIVSAGSGIIGGAVNALTGMKTDKKALENDNNAIDYYKNFSSNASSFEDVPDIQDMGGFQSAYKGGLFSKGKARRKNNDLRNQFMAAESWANRSVNNNIDNIADTQMNTLMANYSALGGPLDNQGAIDYGFMSDYLTAKNKAASVKDKVGSNVFGNLANPSLFALGGDIQTNGSDFTTGLSEINAGKSHEQNPYGGVQVGINRGNGEPNLVEEGETIFDQYVFSNRIKVDKQTKDRFHLGKSADITYADLSKKLQKEGEERPNDAISQAGLRKQLHDLADEQERQKSEKQAEEAQEAFNSLPPEQQAEIMQQAAQQEQQSQQPMEQPMEGMQEQPTESPVVNDQMDGQQMEQPIQEEQMNACGGKLNRFDKGGDMKRLMYSYLPNIHTDSDFDKWAYDQKLDKITDWENITKNKAFMSALAGVNPIVADAISRGYDFGNYKASDNRNLTFDFLHGGWGKEDYNAWKGSKDAAWQEAMKKGLVKEGMNSEQIGKTLMQTDAYKKGSDWLKASDDNRLRYLQAIYNSADAPEAAKKFAGKFVDANGWLKDAKRDYQTIFEDPNGTGVRNTHPGTYWKTPNEILRGNQVTNYVVGDDGTVEEIVGDVPREWTRANSLSWQTADNDMTANYYRRPASVDAANNAVEDDVVTPIHKPTWGRTAGLLGPIAGLGMQALGIGKPDYSRMDAALDTLNASPRLAQYKPIGNRLKDNPMDIFFEQNRMDANSRATDRAILNNSSPIGVKNAGLLANGYNRMIADGDLYRKALEYNDADRMKKAEFNRATDMYNADAFNRTSATNAEILNRNRQLRAQMAMEAANQRMNADASWNQGIYGNVNNFFKGLGAWGKENAQHNLIADMAADGVFGTISDKQNIGKGFVTTRKAAKGGKLCRKRKGLTF